MSVICTQARLWYYLPIEIGQSVPRLPLSSSDLSEETDTKSKYKELLCPHFKKR